MNPMSLWNRMLSLHLYLNHHVVSRRSHTVELLLGGQRLLLIFPLAQDRSSFLGELSQRRASLEGLKMVALPWPCTPCPHQGQHTEGEDQLIHSDQEGNFFRPCFSWWVCLVWHFFFDTVCLTPPCCCVLRLLQIQRPVLLYQFQEIAQHQQVDFRSTSL